MPSLSTSFRYALAANSTSSGFTAQNAVSVEPTGAGVIDLGSSALGIGSANKVPTWIQLMPFGTNADNETFDMRLYGFSPTVAADLVTDTTLYIPQLLIDVTCTLSALTFAGHTADCFLCDTLVPDDGVVSNLPFVGFISPAEDLPGYVMINTHGCRYLKFDFLLGTAAACNCAWRPLEM